MSALEKLAAVRPDHLDPNVRVEQSTRNAELARAMATPRTSGSDRTYGRRLPRLRLRLTMAGMLSLALAGGLVAVQVVAGGGDGGRGLLTAQPASARELLDRAADAAAAPEPIPHPGQYVFVETLSAGYESGIKPGTRGEPRQWTAERRLWESADGSRDGLLKSKPPVAEGDSVDKDGFGAETLGRNATPTGAPGPMDLPYTRMAQLPRDPDELLRYIYRHAPRTADEGRDAAAFGTIGDLLIERLVPPKIRAAMFRATARIPGVTIVRDSADATGRRGIGVALTSKDGRRTEIIFDRTSYRPLGYREILVDTAAYDRRYRDRGGASAGTVLMQMAVLRTAVVDRTGQLP